MTNQDTVWIVLPAYNEERALPKLLGRTADVMAGAGLVYKVIVVDDGSADATPQVAAVFGSRMPLVLTQHVVNLGLGATIRDGLTEACQLAHPDDVIVSMDADNSHSPDLIPEMRRTIRQGHDVVIASRYRPGSVVRGVPMVRRILSRLAGWLLQVAFPLRGVRDYTCGFRAYRAAALQRALQHYGPSFFDQQGFQCMVDILLKLRRLDLVFTEVPIVLRYDLKETSSKMHVWQTVHRTLRLIVKRRLE